MALEHSEQRAYGIPLWTQQRVTSEPLPVPSLEKAWPITGEYLIPADTYRREAKRVGSENWDAYTTHMKSLTTPLERAVRLETLRATSTSTPGTRLDGTPIAPGSKATLRSVLENTALAFTMAETGSKTSTRGSITEVQARIVQGLDSAINELAPEDTRKTQVYEEARDAAACVDWDTMPVHAKRFDFAFFKAVEALETPVATVFIPQLEKPQALAAAA